MATKSRVYIVHLDGKPVALVRAISVAQAIAHVTSGYEAVVADQDHLTGEWARGQSVEDSTTAAI